MIFTKQPVRMIFKKAGAKRVSDKAAIELARVLEERVKILALEANRLSGHAGRRTVMKQDVRMAKRALEK